MNDSNYVLEKVDEIYRVESRRIFAGFSTGRQLKLPSSGEASNLPC